MFSKRLALAAVTTLAVAAPTAATAAPTSGAPPASGAQATQGQQQQASWGHRVCRPTPWGWRCWRRY